MPIDEKPSRNEDEYFVKQDADLIREMRARLDAKRSTQPTDVTKCPRDGTALKEQERHSVKIDVCPSCGGIWLDKGELELLARVEGRSSRVFGSLFGR
jgi:uncharacterized protein